MPASHGGFETFAHYLCLYLVKKGWKVTVYCQEKGAGRVYQTEWQGVKRIHIPIKSQGALGTILFDLKSVIHSLKEEGIILTLGYNTSIFNLLHRIFRRQNIINMDGIEWKRQKWGHAEKLWFWINERLGCWFGNKLIADHPEIKKHLATRVNPNKITMIPYGGVHISEGCEDVLKEFNLEKGKYCILIARPEPENSILEAVLGFSVKRRNFKMIVLGNYDIENNSYHRKVFMAASDEVIFPGAIYEPEKVNSLRFFARFYIHGHQVGGTNPSLVEALGAGNAVLAHDNKFNRWVAAEGAVYFSSVTEVNEQISKLIEIDEFTQKLHLNSKSLFDARFQWESILAQYENVLLDD